jgi:group II intron reverse transcriptase/maturase
VSKNKPFTISKWQVWKAYKLVKGKKGAPGADGQTVEDFEKDVEKNLYKIWNRMSSGTYFPPPVLRVPIPKADGGTRYLGVPTVADRIAQMAVKLELEPEAEPYFHRDSYGYRPGKSAQEAVGTARKRCWQYPWVLDLDIKGMFDHIDHDLMMRAVGRFTDCRWVKLYIDRWLKAPVQLEDGRTEGRDRGTPQGGVISPLLANIFMHLSFDRWMLREHSDIPFERYADDIVVHCTTREQAERLLADIAGRLKDCRLALNRKKTKIVYCEKSNRTGGGDSPTHFDFLGYRFQPRRSKGRDGEFFVNFSPGMSPKAGRKLRRRIRSWRLHSHTHSPLELLAGKINPVIRGWIEYFRHYYKSAMYPVLQYLDRCLIRWVTWKFKRFRGRRRRARYWLGRIARRQPELFAHWLYVRPSAGS